MLVLLGGGGGGGGGGGVFPNWVEDMINMSVDCIL